MQKTTEPPKIDASLLTNPVDQTQKKVTEADDKALRDTLFQQQWQGLNRKDRRKLMKPERSSIYTKKFKTEGARNKAIESHNKKVDALEDQLKRGHL